MKRKFYFTLITLAALVAITTALALPVSASEVGDAEVSITFRDPILSVGGISLAPQRGDCVYQLTEKNGVPVLDIDRYAYFNITDPELLEASELTLSVYVLEDSSEGFCLQYCSETDAYERVDMTLSPSGEVALLTIPLRNADFDGKSQNMGAKLRFENGTICGFSLAVGIDDDTDVPPPTFGEETERNTLRGKGVTGYQMWYRAYNESLPRHWGHWVGNGNIPAKNNVHMESYPYLGDYITRGAPLYQSNLANLGNGDAAMLFHSLDPEIIETHIKWLQDYDIDGIAVQRLYNSINDVARQGGKTKLEMVRDYAEKYGRIFYIMYDFAKSGGVDEETFQRTVRLDFINNVEKAGLLSSEAYAYCDGKPVVCLWGLHGDPGAQYLSGKRATELIQWFKDRGYYVIGGAEDNWFDTRAKGEYLEPFTLVDMISPWMPPTRYQDSDMLTWFNEQIPAELAFCEKYGIEYQPTIYPGFGWSNTEADGYANEYPRYAGQYMWDQAYYFKQLGIETIYFAMFDELDEGTAITKAASDYFEIPTDQYFVTWAADGWWLSNDFYLRTAGAIIDMFQGETEARAEIDVPHSLGPIYWRNSFEMMETDVVIDGVTYVSESPVDVCLNNPELLGAKNVRLNASGIDAGSAVSGRYAFRLNAAAVGSSAAFTYKIADTKIKTNDALELSYWLYAENPDGRDVYVDLLMDDGTRLCGKKVKPVSIDAVGEWQNVTVKLGKLAKGRSITGVLVRWEGEKGVIGARIDDIVIRTVE